MKRRNAAVVSLLLLVLEALPWSVKLTLLTENGAAVQRFYSCLSAVPADCGVITPTATVFLTCVAAALSLYYAHTAHRGVSAALLVLDVIALIAVVGTLLIGVTIVSVLIALLLMVHFILIVQARKV